MNNRSQSRALGIITSAAKIYEEQFCNKNLLIVFGSPSQPRFVSTKGEPKNFYHLTGVEMNKQNILRGISDKSTSPNIVFYEKALNKMLAPDDFKFKSSTTEQKLEVLVQTLKIASNASMLGDYNNCRINLKTEKIAGGQASFLGLIEEDGYYVPNTVISDDIRKNSNFTERVLAVLSKKINEKEYNKIEKVAKKIDINKLLQKIRQDVPVALDLISSSLVKPNPAQNQQFEQMNKTDMEISLQKQAAVKKCDEILNANPNLKAKLNKAAVEYYRNHNLPLPDGSATVDERYEILRENPELKEEYVKAKNEYDKTHNQAQSQAKPKPKQHR